MTDCLGGLAGVKIRYVDIVMDSGKPTESPEDIIARISRKLTDGGEKNAD